MTRTYHRRFHVRGYEMDAASRVHDSVFLKYIQQAAVEASANAGFDTRRYDALGTIWVIRKQIIAYVAPLTYGDIVAITTWVSDMRRVRSHREYELRLVSDGSLVAVAQADWVYIDTTTLFPRRIPAEAFEAFQPNGRSVLELAPRLEPSVAVEGRVFVYAHRVKSYELDNLGHVNNANHLNWLNQARLDALAYVGLMLDGDSAHIHGLVAVPTPVRYEIEYFSPVKACDSIEVHSRVLRVGATMLTWAQQIRRGAERLVEAEATINFQGDDGRATALPSTVLEKLVN